MIFLLKSASHKKKSQKQIYHEGRSPGGLTTEAIRRGREESSRGPLVALGVISPWNPLQR